MPDCDHGPGPLSALPAARLRAHRRHTFRPSYLTHLTSSQASCYFCLQTDEPCVVSLQLATVASSLFYAVWSLYTGFLITKPNIPGWWIWFYYLCPGA